MRSEAVESKIDWLLGLNRTWRASEATAQQLFSVPRFAQLPLLLTSPIRSAKLFVELGNKHTMSLQSEQQH